jgi:hypothetical protein
MPMNRVSITNNKTFRSTGYDAVELLMEVEFRDGRVVLFNDVPMQVYDNFMRANDTTMEEFYHTHIEGQYQQMQVS